jgi:hypothetical protein
MVHVLSMSAIRGKANPGGPLLCMINKEMKKLAPTTRLLPALPQLRFHRNSNLPQNLLALPL